MPPRRVLNERLEELRAQLAASTSMAPAERARLEKLLADVRQHAEGEDAREEPHTLAERLHDVKAHFEESHPNLTLAIGAVADALARIGV